MNLNLPGVKARECISVVASELFKLVDTVCTGNDSSQKQPISECSKVLAWIEGEGGVTLKGIIVLHGDSFQLDFITVNRFIEVVVQPIVKLATKINMAEHSAGTLDDWQVSRALSMPNVLIVCLTCC